MSSHSWHVVFLDVIQPCMQLYKIRKPDWKRTRGRDSTRPRLESSVRGVSSFETGRILRFLIAVMLAERLDCVYTGAPSADWGVNFHRPVLSGFQPVK